MKSIFFQVSMANLSATSVASAVVTTVALIASILSLAVDRWGQFNIPTLIGESKVRLIFRLCPLVKLLEGNVLCRVCLSVCSQGGVIHWTSLYRAHPLDIRHGTLPALPLLDIRHGSPQPWPHPSARWPLLEASLNLFAWGLLPLLVLTSGEVCTVHKRTGSTHPTRMLSYFYVLVSWQMYLLYSNRVGLLKIFNGFIRVSIDNLTNPQIGFKLRYWLHCHSNLRVSRAKIENLRWQFGGDIIRVTFKQFVTSLVQQLKKKCVHKNCAKRYWLPISLFTFFLNP